MRSLRKLTLTDTAWDIQMISAPELADARVPVVIETVLLPPDTAGAGLWSGYDARLPTSRYTGWGAAVDRLSAQTSDMLPLTGESSLVDPLMLPAQSIAESLDAVLPTACAAVVGEGLLATIVENILRHRNTSIGPREAEDKLTLIVDTTGEPSRWSEALPGLCAEGTLLLFVPPWAGPAALDFYPYLHRRSLRVVAKRWHHPPPSSQDPDLNELRTLIRPIVEKGRWIRPLDLNEAEVDAEVWRCFRWAPDS
ncbi:MAG: hypothetical protein ACE5M4_08775 [Anaerolineales bacterium]